MSKIDARLRHGPLEDGVLDHGDRITQEVPKLRRALDDAEQLRPKQISALLTRYQAFRAGWFLDFGGVSLGCPGPCTFRVHVVILHCTYSTVMCCACAKKAVKVPPTSGILLVLEVSRYSFVIPDTTY